MTKRITIIVIIIILMIGGLVLVKKHYRTDNSIEGATDSTIQSEQVDEEENTEAASTDTKSQIYNTEEITALEDGFLKLEPDCNYCFNWDTSAIEENEDGSFTGTFDRASVFSSDKLLRALLLCNYLNTVVVSASLAYAVSKVYFAALRASNKVGGLLKLPNA